MGEHLKEDVALKPWVELEFELYRKGSSVEELDHLFKGAEALEEDFGREFDDNDLEMVRAGVPIGLTRNMPDNWQDLLAKGEDPMEFAQVKWKEELSSKAKHAQTVAIYGKLSGKQKFVSPLTPERKLVKQTIRACQKNKISADDFLDNVSQLYAKPDIEQAIRLNKFRKVATTLLLGTTLLFNFNSAQNDDKNDDSVQASYDEVAISLEDQMLEDSIVAEVEKNTPDSGAEITKPIETPTTTTVPDAETAPPTTQIINAPLATSPPKPTITSFDQRSWAPTLSVVAKKGDTYSELAEKFRIETGDEYDAETLAAFNGGEVHELKVGQRVAYKDCPSNGKLINKGEFIKEFAENNKLTIQRIKELNGGEFKEIAGWCGRIAL